MVSKVLGIPGLFSSEQSNKQQKAGMSTSFEQTTQNRTGLLPGRSVLTDLLTEKESLDPVYINCHRLLDEEITRVQTGETGRSHLDPDEKQSEKVFIPIDDQRKHNIIGRLLGPKGLTLKRMQAETQTKMSILGRGSMRERKKEEELRKSNDPSNAHLKEDLHVLVDATPPYSTSKLAAGVAEVKKMLIPLEPGQPDLIAAKYLEPGTPGLDGFRPMAPVKEPGGSPRGPTPYGRRGGGAGGMWGRGKDIPPPRGMGRPLLPERRSSRGGRDGGRGGYGGIRDGGGLDSYGLGPKPSRREEPPSEPRHGGYGDRDSGPGFGSRGGGFGPESSYGRMDSFEDNDPYFSSFSDSPVSRDYHHGSSSGSGGGGGGGDWKAPRPGRREFRHHPYQQSSSGGFF